MRISSSLCVAALVAGCATAQLQVLHTLQGSTTPLGAGDLGHAVAMIGDVNGDGCGDFVVGEPRHALSTGRVRMISGRDGVVLWTAAGENGQFGFAVARAGNTDGDGIPDVIVGAPSYDGGFGPQGKIYVLDGPSGGLLFARTGANGSSFGFSVDGVGDYDGDGLDDVVVGAPTRIGFAAPDAGGFVVYRGFDGASILTVNSSVAGDRVGYAVAGAGDFNGDNRGDVIIGVPFDDNANGVDAGRFEVWTMIPTGGGLTSVKSVEVLGAIANARMGQAVDGVGDANLDGLDDIIVASPGETSGGPFLIDGVVRVMVGPVAAVRHTFLGQAFSGLGAAVAGAGDVDGDDYADVIIGSTGPGLVLAAPGNVVVRSGLSGAVLGSFSGTTASGDFGFAVAGGVDLDGDRLADVVAGDPIGETVRALGFQLTYPGSLEELHLQGALDNETYRRYPDVRSAVPGDFMRVRMRSIFGGYVGTVPVLLAQLFATGSSPGSIAGYPELHLNGTGTVVLFDGTMTPLFNPTLLAPGGTNFGYSVPVGLGGQSVIFQALCLAPSPKQGNPFFTTTEGQVFVF